MADTNNARAALMRLRDYFAGQAGACNANTDWWNGHRSAFQHAQAMVTCEIAALPADEAAVCEFCDGPLGDKSDHGLGECCPICPTCDGTGSADEAASIPCPQCYGGLGVVRYGHCRLCGGTMRVPVDDGGGRANVTPIHHPAPVQGDAVANISDGPLVQQAELPSERSPATGHKMRDPGSSPGGTDHSDEAAGASAGLVEEVAEMVARWDAQILGHDGLTFTDSQMERRIRNALEAERARKPQPDERDKTIAELREKVAGLNEQIDGMAEDYQTCANAYAAEEERAEKAEAALAEARKRLEMAMAIAAVGQVVSEDGKAVAIGEIRFRDAGDGIQSWTVKVADGVLAHQKAADFKSELAEARKAGLLELREWLEGGVMGFGGYQLRRISDGDDPRVPQALVIEAIDEAIDRLIAAELEPWQLAVVDSEHEDETFEETAKHIAKKRKPLLDRLAPHDGPVGYHAGDDVMDRAEAALTEEGILAGEQEVRDGKWVALADLRAEFDDDVLREFVREIEHERLSGPFVTKCERAAYVLAKRALAGGGQKEVGDGEA